MSVQTSNDTDRELERDWSGIERTGEAKMTAEAQVEERGGRQGGT